MRRLTMRTSPARTLHVFTGNDNCRCEPEALMRQPVNESKDVLKKPLQGSQNSYDASVHSMDSIIALTGACRPLFVWKATMQYSTDLRHENTVCNKLRNSDTSLSLIPTESCGSSTGKGCPACTEAIAAELISTSEPSPQNHRLKHGRAGQFYLLSLPQANNDCRLLVHGILERELSSLLALRIPVFRRLLKTSASGE